MKLEDLKGKKSNEVKNNLAIEKKRKNNPNDKKKYNAVTDGTKSDETVKADMV